MTLAIANTHPHPPPLTPLAQKQKRWKEAIALLEEMIAGGPKIAPTVVSYNSAITACARCNKMPAALRLLAEMSSRSGLTPDHYSYAAVMSGLVKARNPKRALELLEEMRAAGVEPDVVCLASAMEACESKGAPQEAAEVLEQVCVWGGRSCSVCGCSVQLFRSSLRVVVVAVGACCTNQPELPVC